MYQEKDKYRLLIKNLPDGLVYCKVVRDNTGKPVDYIFLEVNSSFEALTGLPRDHIIGKKLTELYPGIKGLGFDWIGISDQVAATGQSIRFQQYFDLSERWYDVTAYSDQPGYFTAVFHDITENKKAEEKLRQREKNFSTLVENTPDMIVRFNLDLQHIYCNAAVEHQFGVPVHRFIGKTFLEIDGPPEQLKSMHQLLKKALKTGKEQQTEQSFPLPSGQKYFQTRIVPERDEKGRIESLLAVTRDITERKQVEEALRESEERYRTLFERTANPILIIDTEGNYLSGNETALQFLECTREELLLKNVRDTLPPGEQATEVMRKIMHLWESGGRNEREYYVNGKIKVLDLTISPCMWNGKRAVFGLGTDITERRQAELIILIQRDLALAISFSHELDEALPRCLDTMLQLSEMDYGGIYLMDQASGDLNLICHRNLSPAFIKSVSHYKADSTYVRLVLQGKPIFTRYSEFDLPLDEVRKAEKLLAFAVLPLSFENRVIGCLNLASKKLEDVSEINREVLKTVATLIGEGITRLKIEEELKLSYQKLQKAIKSTIQAIALILEKRDPYTAGHQKRMTKLACAIAEEISLSPDKIGGLYIAGIIHDIGKINVPTEILSKPGRLSEIEFSLIKTHPQVGSDILKEMELPREVSSIVLQHHERMDGSGYPSGLSGEAILPEARILAVADVVEAMASHRPYRSALGLDKALEEITKNKGKLYDPEVVDACLKLFKEKGFKFE